MDPQQPTPPGGASGRAPPPSKPSKATGKRRPTKRRPGRETGLPLGRPTMCTPEVRGKIIEGVRTGLTYKLACQRGGIAPATMHEWRRRALEGDQPFADFAADLARAEADNAHDLVARVDALSRASDDDRVKFQASQFMLVTRHHEDYGAKQVAVHHTGAVVSIDLRGIEGVSEAALLAMVGLSAPPPPAPRLATAPIEDAIEVGPARRR